MKFLTDLLNSVLGKTDTVTQTAHTVRSTSRSTFSSKVGVFSFSVDGGEAISLSGETVEEERTLDPFEEISAASFANVEVVHDPSLRAPVARITTDKNLLPKILTTVEGRSLRVGLGPMTVSSLFSLKVSIATPHPISGAHVSGSGNLTVDRMAGEVLTIEANSFGDLTVREVRATDKVTVTTNGSGNVEVDTLVTDRLVSRVNSFGNMEIDSLVADTAALTCNGSGNLIIAGTAQEVDVTVNSFGDAQLKRLECRVLTARCSGSGNISAYATEQVKATCNSFGDITVKGGAKNVSRRENGSGSIKVQ